MTTTEVINGVAAADPPPGGARPAGPGPLAVLRAWHSERLLAQHYDQVPGLLAELAAGPDAAADLVRAGRLLEQADAAAVTACQPVTATVTVALTGHCTIGAVTTPLRAELARHGIVLTALAGDYDSYLRDLEDDGSHLHGAEVQLALCILDAGIIFDEMPSPWQAADLEQAAAAKLAHLERLAGAYAGRASGTLVLNTVPLPRGKSQELVDYASRARLAIAWREFNIGLLRLAAAHPRVQVIDVEPLLDGAPLNDPRLAAYAKASLGTELLGRYAREVAHLTRALTGRAKKVLVLDADNTLWDGVLGDDGPDGIAAAGTLRGEAFAGFQKVIRQLGSQGVLLAMSSKNDQPAVEQVLRGHPDMVLRDGDFCAVQANWEPKDANLRQIAARLNLGTDSFVFADDSPFECGLIAAALPGVAVVRLDDEPALHVARLLADGWFSVPELTAEDRARADSYKTDASRARLLEQSGSMADYLAQLGVVVRLAPVTGPEIGRVAQLTLRTNQFNLTTERLQPADVTARSADPAQLVLTIRASDRFGDSGLVGAVFARLGGDGLDVDNVLLSCRVFARGVEQAALAGLLDYAAARGLGPVRARYRPTAKNGKVAGFWPSLGFTPAAAAAGVPDGEARFEHDLSPATRPAVPAHVRLDSELGLAPEGAPS